MADTVSEPADDATPNALSGVQVGFAAAPAVKAPVRLQVIA